MRHRLALVVAICLIPQVSSATSHEASPEGPVEIYGGDPVPACGWPSAVFLGDCTGSLVHPELVIYAAHCIVIPQQEPTEVIFGEDIENPARVVGIESCNWNPDFDPFDPVDFGDDIAYCKLNEPVTDVPITPILMGCEVDELMIDGEVTLVGFGDSDGQPSYGIKREVTTTINQITGKSTRSSSAAAARAPASATPADPPTSSSPTAPGACSASPPGAWGATATCPRRSSG